MHQCAITGCDRPIRARGLCKKHYDHARHAGLIAVNQLNPSPNDRFWARVDQSGGDDACWPWQGSINGHGYGSVSRAGKVRGTHRVAYELLVGPIPEGLTLDHLCHSNDPTCAGGVTCVHRRCVNPAHLQPAAMLVNVMRGQSPHAQAARQTHCAQGHEFTPENTKVYPSRNQRVCLICHRAAGRETQRKIPNEVHKLKMRAWRAARRAQTS